MLDSPSLSLNDAPLYFRADENGSDSTQRHSPLSG